MQSNTQVAASPRRMVAPLRRLRPLLQHPFKIGNEQLRRQLAGEPPEDGAVAYVPLASEIVVCVVYDDGRMTEEDVGRYLLSQADLRRARLTPEKALKIAVANLVAAEDNWAATNAGGVIVSGCTDAYNAARLLAIYPRGRPASSGMSPLVVLVPEQNTLFCAESGDEKALRDMVRFSEHRFRSSAQRISGQPLVFVDGRWQEFVPSRRLEVFDRLRLFCVAAHYREQHELLTQWLRREKRKDQVAPVQVQFDALSGRCFLSADWVAGTTCLLPQVDRVGFYGEGAQWLGWAPWSEVGRILGRRLERLACTPPRWRTRGFPGVAQQRALHLNPSAPPSSFALQ